MDKFLENKVFSALMEAGSFTGAAHTLDMSKAAASPYVNELGKRLVNAQARPSMNDSDLP